MTTQIFITSHPTEHMINLIDRLEELGCSKSFTADFIADRKARLVQVDSATAANWMIRNDRG